MMNSNNIILCTALLAALCMSGACTRSLDEAGGRGQMEITFAPVSHSTSTKAIIYSTVFPSTESFDVSCVFLPNRDNEGHTSFEGAQPMFAATPVTRDPESNTWKTADRYYWPLTGGMKFLCFYPTTSVLFTQRHMYTSITVNPVDYTGAYLGYRIHHTDASYNDITDESLKSEDNLPNAKVDFMSSSILMDNIENRAGDVVPVSFFHNLAQIRFKVKAESDFSSCVYYEADHTPVSKETAVSDPTSWDHANVNHIQIFLDRIELNGIYSKGDYYTNAPNWPKDGHLTEAYRYVLLNRDAMGGTCARYLTEGYTEPRDEDADYHQFGDRTPQAVPITDHNGDDLAVLMIPQHLQSSATLKITYTIHEETDRIYNNTGLTVSDPAYRSDYMMTDYSGTLTRELKLADITPDWVIGTCYSYTIVVGLNEIQIVPAYEEWSFDGTREDVI